MSYRDLAYDMKPLPCKIIDAHTHIGAYYLSGWQQKADKTNLENLLQLMDQTGVDAIVTAPHPMIQCHMELANTMAYEASKEYPGRIYGYISVVPPCGEAAVRQALKEFGSKDAFVGLKFLCGYHGPLLQKEYEYALDFADEMHCPVLMHIWENNPSQTQIIDVLERHHDFHLMVAHQGGGSAKQTDGLVKIMQNYENVSMELCGSLFNTYAVEDLAQLVGVDRLVFGTDSINLDMRYDFGKVAFCPLSDEEKEAIFAGNYLRLTDRSEMGKIHVAK